MNFPTDAPAADAIEVSLFGPGVGECVVVHLGAGDWLVVDSCVEASGRAVALEYLAALGVEPTSIRLVIATHWHDDHTRGLAEVVEAATGAGFVCSGALRRDEFLSLIAAAPSVRRTTKLGSGVDEMTAILDRLRQTGRHPTWATSNQLLLRTVMAELTSLSPSSATLTRSLIGFAAMAPKLKAALRTVPNVSPNETSVVLHLQCEQAVVLLGADLEVTNSKDAGWHAIVASTARPQSRASTYKVAHHGSKTADLDEIWRVLVDTQPASLVSPFTRSRLPTNEDVERLKAVSGRLAQTGRSEVQPVRRDRAVERTVARMAKKPPTPRRGRMGQVRVRLNRATGAVSSVETFGAAFEIPRA